MMSHRIATVLVLTVFLVSLVFVATRISGHVDTNILSLLPGDAQDPVLSDAMRKASEDASNRVAFAIEGGTADQRRRASDRLVAALTASGYFQTSNTDASALWTWLFAHRTELLCPGDRARLEAGEGGTVAHESLLQWYAPMGVGDTRLLQSDPLLLTNRLLGCLLPRSIRLLPHPDAEVISGSITASVFRLDVQDKIAAAIAFWRAEPTSHGLTLSRAGAIFHAAYGAEQARHEISIIGGITTLAVIFFYWMMFRSFRAPLIAVSMVIFSLTIGLAAALAVFGSVHAMALVFGAALIGMVVDYTTYYLVTGLAQPESSMTARKAVLFKPLTLGMVTSVGAFAALLFFPVTAFRQIALFGSVGLAAAWAGTLLLTPRLEGSAMRAGPGAIWTRDVAGRFLAQQPGRRIFVVVLAASLVVVVIGLLWGRTLDDVRQFQAPSRQLVIEEAQIRHLTGFAPSGSFFLVRGASREAATANEEKLMAVLKTHHQDGAILWSASRFDPSHARKASDAALIRSALIAPHLGEVVKTLGAGRLDAYSDMQKNATSATPPEFVSNLRGQSGSVRWSIVPVSGAIEPLPNLTGVQFIEPAARYSDLLAGYRRLASFGLAGAVALTGLMLLLSYRRMSALRILLPTTLALVATPAITSAFGMPFSFFSAMGLFLVAGAGVDYAIFQWESPDQAGVWTRVGIVFAATMTCISVGLLGLSSVLPVRSFGLTVAVGVLLSLVLSPLVRGWTKKETRGKIDEA